MDDMKDRHSRADIELEGWIQVHRQHNVEVSRDERWLTCRTCAQTLKVWDRSARDVLRDARRR